MRYWRMSGAGGTPRPSYWSHCDNNMLAMSKFKCQDPFTIFGGFLAEATLFPRIRPIFILGDKITIRLVFANPMSASFNSSMFWEEGHQALKSYWPLTLQSSGRAVAIGNRKKLRTGWTPGLIFCLKPGALHPTWFVSRSLGAWAWDRDRKLDPGQWPGQYKPTALLLICTLSQDSRSS